MASVHRGCWALILAWLPVTAAMGGPEVETRTVEYRDGETVLEGYLAWQPGAENAPGVMVVHAWRGLDAHARKTAEMLAERGYVGFACDIYGQGVRPRNTDEARTQATKYRSDRALLRQRARAGLAFLRQVDGVDPTRLAALGYCFGGGTVLELARSGADLLGVISFHGNLDTPDPAAARNIKAKVLVLHGAEDRAVPDTQVQAFKDEMRAAQVDWTLVSYGGAVHGFTHEDAGTDKSTNVAYDPVVAGRAYRAMDQFLEEIFATGR